MESFFKKLFSFGLIASLPLMVLLAGYIYYDPFKVLRSYRDLTYFQPIPHVIPNRDYVSTAIYINEGKREQYNSFVFGSSRTVAFTAQSWKKHLSAQDKVFFFDASGEAIYGIYTKIKYLDEVDAKLDNALILFCRDAIFEHTKNFNTHLKIKHPATSGESWLYFHFVFFKAYLNFKFLMSFYDYSFTGRMKPYMKDFISAGKKHFDPGGNAVSMTDEDKTIDKDPESYYNKRKEIFFERKGESVDSVSRINETSLYMLKEIKRILKKHNTRYRIILSPIYDQKKFAPRDLRIMREIFGYNLYDFTGENAVTRSKYNWYEDKHFRTFVGDSLLNIVYKAGGQKVPAKNNLN